MQLLDEESRLVLEVVDQAANSGRPLTEAEYNRFASHPRRKTTNQLAFFAGSMISAETTLDYLTHAGLVAIEAGAVSMSKIGRMLLSAAQRQDAEVAAQALERTELVLGAGDEWAIVDMMTAVRRAGACMVVDPYCRVDELQNLVRYTQTSRVLIGPKVTDDLGLVLDVGGHDCEVRVSDDVHDRHVIPDNGPVLTFGVSINGAGKSPSFVAEMSSSMSDGLRRTYGHLWTDARPWAPADPPIAHSS